jgi:serine/threonine protein phosphatase PrpC
MTTLLERLRHWAWPRRSQPVKPVAMHPQARAAIDGDLTAEVKADGRFEASAITHPGSRRYNEDSYASYPELGVWVVADGVGGHQAGEVASRTITEALGAVPLGLNLKEMIPEVRRRIEGAHQSLQAEAASRGRDVVIASTVVVLLAQGDQYACLWAGDSRAYLLRNGMIRQVTKDHSLVQEMVSAGALKEEEAEDHPQSNVITRAVGAGVPQLQLDEVSERLDPGDRFLLCSDGLWKLMRPPEIASLLEADGEPPAQRLLATALTRKADDNLTIVTVRVSPE